MATRRDKLQIDFIADDKVSKVAKDAADAVDKLDGKTAEVDIVAEDRATAEVQLLMGRISSLTDDEKKVALTAESRKLQSEVDKAIRTLGRVDGARAEAVLDAKDLASKQLDAVQSELREIDGRPAEATLEATDHASGDIDRVQDDLDTLDKTTATATIDATGGAGLTDLLDNIEGVPGQLQQGMGVLGGAAGAAGAIGLATAATVGLVTQAANWGAEVAEVASLTGDSTEDVSRFLRIWKDAGFEKGDLLDIVAQMVGVLEDSPEIAEQLGIKLDGSMTPLEMLKTAIEGLNDGQLSANERILLGSKLFGEEGVRQINGLVTVIGGDLQGALDGVADSQVLSEDEVEKALELKRQFMEISAQVQALTGRIGQAILPPLTEALALVDRLEEVTGVDVLDASMGPLGADPGSTADVARQIIAQQMLADAYDVTTGAWGDYLELAGPAVEATEAVALSTEGLNERMAELAAAENPLSVLSDHWRTLIDDFKDGSFEFENAADAVQQLSDATGLTTDQVLALIRTEAARELAEAAAAADALAGSLTDTAAAAAEAATKIGTDAKEALEDQAAALGEAAEAIREEHIAALRDEVAQIEDNIELLEGRNDAIREGAGLFVEVEEATEDLADATEAYAEAQAKVDEEDTAENREALKDATDGVRDSVIDLVNAEQAKADADAQAAGTSRSRVEQIDSENAAYLREAATLNGSAREAVLAHVLRLNGIPEERITEILTDTDPNDIAQVEAELGPNGVSRTRQAAIAADVAQWARTVAETQLNYTSRDRDSTINVDANVQSAVNAIGRVVGALRVAQALRFITGRATGDTFFAGGEVLVGEGPGAEIVTLPAGSKITNAGQSEERLGNAEGGGTVVNNYITNNLPRGLSSRDTAAALRRQQRIQGPR